jgi:hypothetical protein
MSVGTHLTSVSNDLVLSAEEKTSITTSISTLSSRLDSYFENGITDHFSSDLVLEEQYFHVRLIVGPILII